jgi:hypothetical protein
MISNRITQGAAFLKMPVDSQLLYMHLVLNADDDGIVEAFQVMRMINSNEGNLQHLQAKKYVEILNENLVTYICDWEEHNKIRPDRLTPSIHRSILVKNVPDLTLPFPKPRSDVLNNSPRLEADSPRSGGGTAQVKLSKGKLSQDSIYTTTPAFDSFWLQYPRKVKRFTAWTTWEKKVGTDGLVHHKIMEALEKYKKSAEWLKDQGRFIPHPTTWLNGKRWEDEVELYENKSIKIS